MKANNPTEKIILDYFEKNASEDLKKRVEKENKTIAGALHYASEQARKQKSGNCAVVTDDVVFGWIMHYFEDEPAQNHEGKDPSAKVEAGGRTKVKKIKGGRKTVTVRKDGTKVTKLTPDKPVETPAAVTLVVSKKEIRERAAGQLFLFDAEGGAE